MKSFKRAHSLKGATDTASRAFRTRFLSPFEESMNNRIQKEEHVRAKPKLVAVNSTGGFKLNQKHK